MTTIRRIRRGTVLVWTALATTAAALSPSLSVADVPHIINWQAVALDSNGVAIDDQTYFIHFRIYDDGVGGNLLWAEIFKQVIADHGLLNAFLGDSNPIPDTVFADIPRYLEIEFDGELPFDRVELQSVAYAFGAGTLDGAEGGQITTDIEMTSMFTVPAVVMFREGTSTVIGWFRGDGDGADLRLYDGTGFPFMLLYPTAGGLSAALELFASGGGGTGVAFLKSAGDGPVFWAPGLASTMSMNMDSVGNDAVEWPVDALHAAEILDEPGIASAPTSATPIQIYNSIVTVSSATITPPDSGYVVVISEASFRNYGTNNFVSASLTQNGSQVSQWWMDAGDMDLPQPWTDQRQTATYTGAVGPGTYTYAFRVSLSADSALVAYPKVTAMYFPRRYGTVAVVPPMADRVGSDGEQLLRVDRRHDAQAARRESEASIRDQTLREMEKVQRQMEELEARFAERFKEQADDR